MKLKRSVLLCISSILGTIVSIAYIASFSSYFTPSPTIGDALGMALVFPHVLCTWFATLFNWIGFFTKMRGFSLASAILYCVAALFMPMAFYNVIVQAILSFIGYARQNSLQVKDKQNGTTINA